MVRGRAAHHLLLSQIHFGVGPLRKGGRELLYMSIAFIDLEGGPKW